MHRGIDKRLADLERARWERLTPLEQAHKLIERGVAPQAWPDAALEAFCETLPPEIRSLSDAELEAVIEQAH